MYQLQNLSAYLLVRYFRRWKMRLHWFRIHVAMLRQHRRAMLAYAKTRAIADRARVAAARPAVLTGEPYFSATGDVADAVALIHATSKAKRSEFQKDIWEVRKERYGPSGRKDGGSVPF